MSDVRRLTGIYLDDHVAVITGGEELVKRVLGETKDDEIRDFLRELLPELRDDREAAERLLRATGRSPSALKQRVAWLGEKAGRLKLNGNPTGYSPLTRLVELEGIRAVLESGRALWAALERAGPEDARGDAARRRERAEERLERAEHLRLEAADVVFAGGERRL